jgi:ParB-like chromosome segregation protein Spo0J
MSEPQRLALADIDRRFASLRLAGPEELRRLRASVQREGIRDPVVVSGGVEAHRSVLLDGFKRVRVAEELGLAQVWAQAVPLDAAQAKAAILHCNQARPGLCEIEEAWIVRSLCREQGLRQAQVGQLLGRDKSWVCRRLKLAEALDATLQDDLRLGLLSATAARELAQLPRGNQLRAAAAVRDHQLTSRQSARLVEQLRQTSDPVAVREVLADPLRYLAAETQAASASPCDPRLSEGGNRLRRLVLSWEGICGHLTRSLCRYAPAGLEPAEARVLGPVLQQASSAGRRVTEQLEALEIRSGLHEPGGAAHA